MSIEFKSPAKSPTSPARYREVAIGHPAVEVLEVGGILHMRSLETLEPMPERLLDRLVHWAQVRPEHTFIAARDSDGEWRRISYAQMLEDVRAIAQSLLVYGLGQSVRWQSCQATILSICRWRWGRCTPVFLTARFHLPIRCCPRILPSCAMSATCCSQA